MMGNPWQVESIEDFACLKCPECVFFCKEEDSFRDHALENHPKSFELFWEEFEEETKTNNLFNGKEIKTENLSVKISTRKDENESQKVSATSVKSKERNDRSLSTKTCPNEKSKTGETKLKCPFCMVRYSDQQVLNEHIQKTHDKSSLKLEVQTASSVVTEKYHEDLDKLMSDEMELDSEEDDQLLMSNYQNALKRKAENNQTQIKRAKVQDLKGQSVMSNLTIDSNSGEETKIDEDFFKDHRIFLSNSQRVEVLTKICAERDFLFGKLKYGITRQKRDECRERFIKWCHLRGIPYQTWKKVETQYNQWKSDFKKKREKSGSRAQHLENWEQLLELCEREGSEKPKRTRFEIEMWGDRLSTPDHEINSNKDLIAQSLVSNLTIDSKKEKETYLDRKKSLKCTICNACIPYRKQLYAHTRKYHHQSIAMLNVKCPHCEDIYDSCKALKRHHLTAHKGKVSRRPFTCALCPAQLNSIAKLHIHISFHKGKKPYQCNICCINFKFRHNLYSHLKQNHGNNAPENDPMSFELYWQEVEVKTDTNKLIYHKEINASKVDAEEVRTKNQNLENERMNIDINTNHDLKGQSVLSNLTKTQIEEDDRVFLSIAQREEVLEKIGAEREFLFGKFKYGVTRQKRDECRESFFKWCDLRRIPYQTWKKVETHYYQWKSTFKKNQELRERSGSRAKPLENWEQLLELCELEGQVFKPEKPKRTVVENEMCGDRSDHEIDSTNDLTDQSLISNLTIDSKSEKEIQVDRDQGNFKEPKLILTTLQREEVLSKIVDERDFLFGKVKDGVTRAKKDEYRKQFLKWCKVRRIPYKEWKKVEENWRNWKSMCFINQSEREIQTGSGVKSPEKWEQFLLANCEREDSKPFECSICNKGSSSELNLKFHIKKFHTVHPTNTSVTKEKDNLRPVSLKCNTCKQFFPELLYKDHVNLCKQYSNNVKRTSKGYQCQICQHESSNLNKLMFDHLKICLLEEELVGINSVPYNYILEHSEKDLDCNEKQIKTSINAMEKSKVILENRNEKEAERKFQKYLSKVIDLKVKEAQFHPTIINAPESKLDENISVPIETSNMTNMVIDSGLVNSRNGDNMGVNLLNPNMISYSCFECPDTFDDTVKLNEHYMLMHDKKKNWEDQQFHTEKNEEPFQKINPSVQEKALRGLDQKITKTAYDKEELDVSSDIDSKSNEALTERLKSVDRFVSKIDSEDIASSNVEKNIFTLAVEDMQQANDMKELNLNTDQKVSTKKYENHGDLLDAVKSESTIDEAKTDRRKQILAFREENAPTNDKKEENLSKFLFLTIPQREEVLAKIGAERDLLFGKLKYGVTRQKRDECRESFFRWCALKGIPYQTWKKVETHYNQWKSTFNKNQREREKTGAMAKPLKDWEKLLATCEMEGQIIWGDRSDHEIDSERDLMDQSLIPNLTIDSKREKEIQVNKEQDNSKEPSYAVKCEFAIDEANVSKKANLTKNLTLTMPQREEVLTKIASEKDLLFGKIKHGVKRQKRDDCRERFFKWCHLRGIPYKTWMKVETHYNQWKSTFNKNQREREKTGPMMKPLKNWERLLETCEMGLKDVVLPKPNDIVFEMDICDDTSGKLGNEDHDNPKVNYTGISVVRKASGNYGKLIHEERKLNPIIPSGAKLFSKPDLKFAPRIKLKCPFCEETFVSCETLKKHNNEAHEGKDSIYPFSCILCPSKFDAKSVLQDHMSNHDIKKETSENNYESTISNLAKSDIMQNTLNVLEHSNDTEHKSKTIELFSCDLCKQTFVMETHLKEHLKSVHGEEVLTLAITNNAKEPEGSLEVRSDLMNMDQKKKNHLKQLKSNRKVYDEKVILSNSQREEVLTKIVTERDVLFGKLKDGITRKQKDKCRDDFLNWCQSKGIPYKTWGKISDNYYNWQSRCKKNQHDWIGCAISGKMGLCESKDTTFNEK